MSRTDLRPSCQRHSSSWRRGLLGLAAPLIAAAASADAGANIYAMQTSEYHDRVLLQDTIKGYASVNVDIDEMASSPDGHWIVVAGNLIHSSHGFNASCRAKVQEYVNLGLEIDVIAFAPNGAWMVIAEHLAWHSAGLSYVDTLEAKILERIHAGKRITDLAFDSDNSGWTLISGNWAHSVAIPSDLYAAVVERHPSKRSIEQVEIAADGRWALLADDWYASSDLTSTGVSWLKSFQKNQWSLDRLMLGLSGNFVLFGNGAFVPDMTDPMQSIEYGLAENIWKQIEDAKVAGVSIAVIEGNEIQWARTYGEIEAGSQRFLRADTPMDTASVSKPIAAMTMMSLVEDGVTSLDMNVQTAALLSYYKFGNYWNPLLYWVLYGPAFQNGLQLPATEMTLRRLLSHSASLEPWGTTSYLPGDKLPNTLQMLFGHDSNGNSESYGGGNMVWYDPFILDNGIQYQPGDVFRYSGGGYMAAQAMAESLTLVDFEQHAKTRILDVLDMDDSTFYQPLSASFADRAALPHDSNGVVVPANQRPIYPWASGGGLYASASDVARATIALMNGGIGENGQKALEAGSVTAMLTKQAAGSTTYGLGLTLTANTVTAANGQWFTHNGGHPNASARMGGRPSQGTGIVILISSGTDAADALREEIFSRFKTIYGW